MMQINEIWFGKPGTAYEGVVATIETITARNVQLKYNRVVQIGDVRLFGEVMSKGKFAELFDQSEQLRIELS